MGLLFAGVLAGSGSFSGASAQTAATKSSAAKKKADAVATGVSVVTSVSVIQEKGVPAVEILSTLPSVPSIQFVDSPPRLVVDLLHAQLGLKQKPPDVHEEGVLGVRAEQFQADPPIARVVVDLKEPSSFTWDEAGNRLMVRLKPAEEVSKKSRLRPRTGLGAADPTVASVGPAPGLHEVSLEEGKIAAGSTVTSGADTAVLHLSRGGEVRICPQSSVSVTPSNSSNDLMLGMNNGALETHYTLHSSSDTVMTPDFRILFAGPGEFDFALSTNARGDTCVRGLKGNASSAIVSELMGDRIYQVKPSEQAVFRSGRIDKVDTNVPLECGCPTSIAVMRADVTPGFAKEKTSSPAATQGNASPAKPEAGEPGNLAAGDKSLPPLSNGPEIQPVPPSEPNAVHVQVEAPMVFHAKQASPEPISPTNDATPGTKARVEAAETVPPPAQVAIAPTIVPPAASATQPPPQALGEHPSAPRRALRRIKGFFSSMFH